ncbi:MAG: hypothetical protein LBD48_00545 [Treponema sp.]|jgi:hypothetical protein|nr:hypothetical protein [Treponema sp.]
MYSRTVKKVHTHDFSQKIIIPPGILHRAFITGCVLALLLLNLSCELFNNRQEIDLEAAIDEKIRIANAPEINVDIAVTGRGTVTGGNITGGPVKQGVSFNLAFSPSTDYGFTGWNAYLNAIAPENLLGSGDVTFSDAQSQSSAVTVYRNPGDGKIIIEACTELVGTVRVKKLGATEFLAAEYDDTYGFDDFTGTPQYIQLQFDKPMDPRSFVFPDMSAVREDDSSETAYFNNIAITGTMPYQPYDEIPFGYYYCPPRLSVDGKLLTFWVKEKTGAYYWRYASSEFSYAPSINLALDGQIRDRKGIPITRSYRFDLHYANIPLPGAVGAWGQTAGIINGIGDWGTDQLSKNNFSGKNYLIIKAGASGDFPPGVLPLDPQTHNVFDAQGEWIYLAMLLNYGASMPRAFIILETEQVTDPTTWYFSGTEVEIVNDPRITIPLSHEFEKHLDRNGRQKDGVYPLIVVKYRLKNWNYPPGTERTVYLRCAPLHIATPEYSSPSTYDYWTVGSVDDANPGRFQINYRIP